MDIGIVLVTFNRLEKLKLTLNGYENQTIPPSFVLVVDNHSDDGTCEYLRCWEKQSGVFQHIVVTLAQNSGGSGGFYTGMKKALALNCSWIFVADDDAIPEKDMLSKLVAFAHTHQKEMRKVSALCTAVDNHGRHSGIHRCRLKRGILGYIESYVPEKEYKKSFFYFDIYSFVGCMLRREALEKAGLARKDFFIYSDDYEHAVRINKTGKIICVPSSVMYHTDNLEYTREATWRDYYATRNAVIMHLKHFGKYAGFMRALRRLAVGILSLNPQKIKIICIAIKDGYCNRCGIHPVYKPGWKAGK